MRLRPESKNPTLHWFSINMQTLRVYKQRSCDAVYRRTKLVRAWLGVTPWLNKNVYYRTVVTYSLIDKPFCWINVPFIKINKIGCKVAILIFRINKTDRKVDILIFQITKTDCKVAILIFQIDKTDFKVAVQTFEFNEVLCKAAYQ